MDEHEILDPEVTHPTRFTQSQLAWRAWLPPVPEDELSAAQESALQGRRQVNQEYFRLLARDPAVLIARTHVDEDIFKRAEGGLDRGERELLAAAASRLNGCMYCASVHSAVSTFYTKRQEDVQRLLDDGLTVDIDPRWNALIQLAAQLTATPATISDELCETLISDFDPVELLDGVMSTAFFAWANRLMLSFGTVAVPD